MVQTQKTKQATKTDQPSTVAEDQALADVAERKGNLDSDIDNILDEIDGVLEENAQEFVKAFVQKGGQ